MTIKSLEEYVEFYNKNGYLLDGQYSNPKKTLNKGQLKFKYERYIRKSERKESNKGIQSEYVQKVNEAMLEARRQDPAANLFWDSLTEEEYDVVFKEMKKLPDFREIDPCHIFGRGQAPQLADNLLNIVMAPRAFHNFVDKFLNPFSEKHEGITKEQHEQIWRHIVGDERYDTLLNLKRGQ